MKKFKLTLNYSIPSNYSIVGLFALMAMIITLTDPTFYGTDSTIGQALESFRQLQLYNAWFIITALMSITIFIYMLTSICIPVRQIDDDYFVKGLVKGFIVGFITFFILESITGGLFENTINGLIVGFYAGGIIGLISGYYLGFFKKTSSK